jgi:UDP-GlcNAc3NAcA epimerase
MEIVTIVGARPQFIKAAAVSREIARHPDIREIIVHTGQHFDDNMSKVFFDEMQIPEPAYNLNINSMNHGAMTGRMLEGIENILMDEKPDFVMVYGDTNSTLAGALAAKKLHIRVVHVEAGLRSFNMQMPEEINRILTDRISSILCCPTDRAVENLEREGFRNFNCSIVKTGDVMYDAAMFYADIASKKSGIMERLKMDGKDFALCTVHRAENTDDPVRLRNIFEALGEISKEMIVILPVHPRTRKILESLDYASLFTSHPSLMLIDPVSYFDMIELLKNTEIVLTDSGGLQKEAFFFKKPCVTLRDETEWVELVDGGYNRVAGAEVNRIINAYDELEGEHPDFSVALYGNGSAGRNIIAVLQKDRQRKL